MNRGENREAEGLYITIVCTCTIVYTSNTCMNRGENREAEGLYIITLP